MTPFRQPRIRIAATPFRRLKPFTQHPKRRSRCHSTGYVPLLHARRYRNRKCVSRIELLLAYTQVTMQCATSIHFLCLIAHCAHDTFVEIMAQSLEVLFSCMFGLLLVCFYAQYQNRLANVQFNCVVLRKHRTLCMPYNT